MNELRRHTRLKNRNVSITGVTLVIVAFHLNAQAFESGNPERLYSKQYASCMANTDGVTVEMRECINKELVRQDERLNQAYRKYSNSLSSSVRNSLKEAQRAWIHFRNKECIWAGASEGGGTLGPVIVDNCHLELTTRRASEFESLLSQR